MPADRVLAALPCLLLLLQCGLLASCGGAQRGDLPDGPLVEGEGPGFDPMAPRYPGEEAGKLERSEVDEVLLAGPQAFISKLRLSPALVGDKFIGFRLEEFFPGDPRFRQVDLHPGDVILRVNGQPIGQPDEFMKVWEQLKVAPELRIEYLRGALVRVLRWQITDGQAVQPTLVP